MGRMGNVSLPLVFISLGSLFWGAAPAHGSGFAVFTQGASALGQANAVVAHGDGPSAVYFNPALMSFLPGTQVEVGTTLIIPHREFRDSAGTVTTTKETVFYPGTFFLTHTFNDTISAGLGVFSPFGLGTDWGGDWSGRYIATNSEVRSLDINPAMSYRITPSLSVAAGIDIVLLDATLENRIYTPAGDVGQKFTGDGHGIGGNVGVVLDAGNGITIGAAYRSEVKVDVSGTVDFVTPSSALAGAFPNTGGRASITLPQQVTAGMAYQATKKLILETGMRWEDWSSFKQLQVTFDQPVASVSSATYPRNWHSTFAVNAGGEYRINDTFSMMAGYLYGWNPVPDSTFEPAIPDSDTHLFCVGWEARFDRLKVDLGYAYQLQYERVKSANQYGTVADGTYNSDIHLVGLSMGYRF